MPCDAACRKIIINTGFMATLAPVLAKNTGWGKIRAVAEVLSVAADTYQRMLVARGYVVEVDAEFTGCEQAKLLVKWIITEDEKADIEGKVKLMGKWVDDLWLAIADLAAGKLPT